MGQVQRPAMQVEPPVQRMPQPPQFRLSVCVFAQVPPQAVVPVGHAHMPLVQVAPVGH